MSKNIKSTQSPHKLVLYLSVIKLRKMICPQHFYNIFTIFLQQILNGKLLLVVIVEVKK